MTAYETLCAEANRVGYPEAYVNDLHVHDCNRLGTENPGSFLWILRRCGTHLFTPEDMGESEKSKQWVIARLRHTLANDKTATFYIYSDGTYLREMTRRWISDFADFLESLSVVQSNNFTILD